MAVESPVTSESPLAEAQQQFERDAELYEQDKKKYEQRLQDTLDRHEPWAQKRLALSERMERFIDEEWETDRVLRDLAAKREDRPRRLDLLWQEHEALEENGEADEVEETFYELEEEKEQLEKRSLILIIRRLLLILRRREEAAGQTGKEEAAGHTENGKEEKRKQT